jgi:non-ribosomal peptide synthetase-like protein
LTYGELDRRSDSIAARLAGRAGRLVAILLPRDTPDLFASELGILKAGAAYVCIDPAFPDGHARSILEDADAALLITDLTGAARGLPVEALDVATVGPAPHAPLPRDASDLAYVIYTSGTTGRPKGVMIDHRSIANLAGDDILTFGLTPDDRVAQGTSHAYDSSVEETWLAFAVGATLVVMDDETARLGPDLAAWLRRERVTVFCPPPTLLLAMGRDTALPDLRLLYVGGEALTEEIAERWARGVRLENGYGPTECTVTATRATVRAGEPVAIGRPVRGMQAWILDSDLREVPDGTTGELCLGGIGLARGYRNRPELTRERFPDHPTLGRIYRTGDLARRGEDGALFCLGRIDAQVKLRGYRVELPAIEAKLRAFPGVREAACSVQENAIVAYVVPNGAPPCLDALRAAVTESLPAHMVPSRFKVLDRLPVTTGGKLDRARLPKLDGKTRDGTAPRTDVEKKIAAAFEAATRRRASVHDDFFKDLGGDSLGTAEVVSALRNDPETAGIAVRDIYEARTVEALAKRALPVQGKTRGPGGRISKNPLLATLVQGAVILLGIAAATAVAYGIVFVILPPLLRAIGIPLFLLFLPVLAFAAVFAYAPLALLAAAVTKKLLVGTYRPMRAPAWGGFFVRNWIVQRASALVPWGLLRSVGFQCAALRLLGARIGQRVSIDRGVNLENGGWDLLEIGDDATVGRDASLRVVDLDDGEIVFAPVVLGARSTVDVRATVAGGAAVGQGSFLAALSWLPPGARVPDGERWDGVPASAAGAAPEAPSLPSHKETLLPARFMVAALVSLAPFAFLALLGIERLLSVRCLLGVVAAVPIGLLAQALALKALGRVKPSSLERWSLAHLRVSIKCGAVEEAGRWLAGTLLWPVWLKLAGMRIGRKCEISSIMGPVPELLEIGDESFLADGIYLAGPRVRGGIVTVSETRLGRRTFLGNHVVVPAGQKLSDDLFVGVCTVTAEPSGAWFGHPPFELSRRPAEVDRRLTHDPPLARRATRWFFELLRFALPAPMLLLFAGWCEGVQGAGLALAPLVTLATGLAACVFVIALKWALLGRVRPGQHAFWSCWCGRWDFLYVAWELLARPVLSVTEGTLLLPWYLRAMGARIGRRVVLGGGFSQVVDPDMLDLGDGSTVSALFQAHSFEDRVLKIDVVRVRAGATVGAGAVVFFGSDIGEGARVAPNSVVMKHERLLPGRSYEGCPTRSTAPRG